MTDENIITDVAGDEPVAESLEETAAEPAAEPIGEPAAEVAETVDAQRQAELDALAAELAGAGTGAVAKAPARRKSRRVTAKDPAEFAEQAAAEAPAAPESGETPADAAPEASGDADPAEATESPAADETDGETNAEGADGAEGESSSRSRSRRGRNRRGTQADGESDGGQAGGQNGQQGGQQNGQNGGQQNSQNGGQQGQNGQQNPRDRKRGRGRGALGDDLEPEIFEDDVLIPVAGILDVLENYAFVRTTGYLPGVSDVYVSLGQVKKYGMRKGDAVIGAIRQPRDGEQAGRQKYNALVKVDSVNGLTAEQSNARPEFAALTPIRATEGFGVQVGGTALHKGQRVLVVGGHGSGKTGLVASVAEQISALPADVHLMVILLGARPEEGTEFRRSVKGEVIVSGLEDGVEDTVTVVELAVERAKRLVEFGHDVVVVIDSLHQLGRAYAALAPTNRHGVEDQVTVLSSKRLFASARSIEDAASLTVVATAAEDTAGDRFVVTELSSLANAVIRL